MNTANIYCHMQGPAISIFESTIEMLWVLPFSSADE